MSAMDIATVPTSFGPIDLLLGRGRLDWQRLCGRAAVIPVADVGVLVAAAQDAWDLRHRFKG
jgi:hypothetical protein